MTPDQEAHLNEIVFSFQIAATAKYKRGAQEHKGDLLGKTPLELLVEMRDEAIDLYIYAQTAIQKQYLLDSLKPKKRKHGK